MPVTSYRNTCRAICGRGWRSVSSSSRRTATDADVPLNLQALIERCYHHGRYDDINYRADPHPPLEPADAAWANELLAAAGLR